jgi:aspartyl-tRNA(Asn)/glutamyl-tRNA(Gln) amidotransferase subunit A
MHGHCCLTTRVLIRIILQKHDRVTKREENTMTDWKCEDFTIAGVAPQIESKKISPVELTKLYLDRVARLNPVLNAYVTVMEEEALADAQRAEREILDGKHRGPLHGIPVSIKDNLAVKGVRATAGTKILANWKPDFDATVVTRLRDAGAIVLGKTNMHEWAGGGTTINHYYGTTFNPWGTTRVPGGSSGGSAAAVAANLCLASIGTDNAGSVRNPASYCGVVGLKATYGRVSRYGGVAGTGGFSSDHFGPFTQTVQDCALVLANIAGEDAKDPLSSSQPVPDYGETIGSPVKGMKAGVIKGYFDQLMVGETAKAFRDALEVLKSLGMSIEEVNIPHMDLIPAVQTVTSRIENVVAHEVYLRTCPRDYSPALFERLVCSLTVPAATYVTAQRVRRLICDEFEDALDKVQVIVAPTVGMAAPTIEECNQGFAEVEGERVNFRDPRGSFGTLCTIPFNVTGLPALSLCCGFSSAGAPLGIQVVGGNFQEATVFQVAHAYEREAGWHTRKPVLPV